MQGNILGLQFGHDASACVIKNGRLVSAIARERLTRVKHVPFLDLETIQYVLDVAGLTLDEIDCVAFCGYCYSPKSQIQIYDLEKQQVQSNLFHVPFPKMFAPYLMGIGNTYKRAYFVSHQLCHAASAFYTSPFEKSAVFTMDASGPNPQVSSLYCVGNGNKLEAISTPGLMIGNAYGDFTERLGIGPGIDKAGSTMGLAPYGTPRQEVIERWEELGESIWERADQENYKDFEAFLDWLWSQISGLGPKETFTNEQSTSQEAMDIAASLQYVFERTIVKYTNRLHETTNGHHDNKLCLSGGSFLNCNANMKVHEETEFDEIHLFPACGDDGLAPGAALYVYHHLLDGEREAYAPKDFMYLGKEYTNIPTGGRPIDTKELAKALSEGALIAWCQGRAEFGPRALGNRSLIADPRNANARELINEKIKCREWYRPFAPAVLVERSTEFFDCDFESPLMLFIAQVKQPEVVPAITHVDNSARVQTVQKSDNPMYYQLIEDFGEQTGVPVILNTSLNVNGEPIVETPEDAIRFFINTKVDYLVINDQMFDASCRALFADKLKAAS